MLRCDGTSHKAKRPTAIAIVTAVVGILALAAPPIFAPPAKAAGAAVPNFTGVWGKRNFGYPPPYVAGKSSDFSVIDGFNNPILRPWTVQYLTEKMVYTKSGNIFPDASTSCWPTGVPGIYNFRHIQILQSPDQMTIFYKNNNQSRTIFLNQKHSPKPAPSWYGESVGHFEGDTLVIDTTGFLRRPEASLDDFHTPVTEGLHVVERFRYLEGQPADEPPARPVTDDIQNPNRFALDAKGKIIHMAFSVEDPNTFKKPWSVSLYFRPVLTPAFLEETICAANNRDWVRLIPTAATPDF